MLRNIGFALLALLAFGICVSLGDMASGAHNMPAGMDPSNMESIREHMLKIPLSAFLVMMLGHLVGSVLAGWLVARFTGNSTTATVVGALILLGATANLVMVPHPAWFWTDILIYPLGVWAGWRLGRRHA